MTENPFEVLSLMHDLGSWCDEVGFSSWKWGGQSGWDDLFCTIPFDTAFALSDDWRDLCTRVRFGIFSG